MTTTHPEDAMTRERAISAMADKMMASDDTEPRQRRAYYVALAAVGYDAALTSAQQEPAPAADVPVDLEIRLRRALTFKEAERVMAALRRYAGDGRCDCSRQHHLLTKIPHPNQKCGIRPFSGRSL